MIGIALLGAGRMARVHAKATGAAGGRLVTDGLRTAYLAEAATMSLRLGQAVELKSNCEVTWHE
jgi:hypothetical protein